MTRENFDDLSWRSMVLQFDGECIHCGKKISNGTRAQWFSKVGVRHEKCAELYRDTKRLEKNAVMGLLIGDYFQAKKFAEKAFDIHPQNEAELLKIADYFFDGNEFEKAVKIYDKILKKNPHSYIGYLNKGAALTWLGKNQLSIKNYKRALREKPDDIDTMGRIATAYEYMEKYDDAIKIQRKIHRLQPAISDHLDRLEKMYLKIGDFENALKINDKILKLKKNTKEEINYDLLDREEIFSRLIDEQHSEKDALIKINQNTKNSEKSIREFIMWRFYYRFNKDEEARKISKKYLESEPKTDYEIMRKANYYYNIQSYTKAIEFCEENLKNKRIRSHLHVIMARSYQEKKDYGNAVIIFTRLVKAGNSSMIFLNALAENLELMGDWKGAILTSKSALEKTYGRNNEALHRVIRLLKKTKSKPELIEYLRTFHKIALHNKTISFELLSRLIDNSEYYSSMEIIEQLEEQELDSDELEMLRVKKGICLYHIGDNDQAHGIFTELLRKNPKFKDALDGVALTSIRQGKNRDAQKALKASEKIASELSKESDVNEKTRFFSKTETNVPERVLMKGKNVVTKPTFRYNPDKKIPDNSIVKTALNAIVALFNSKGGILRIGITDKKPTGITGDLKVFARNKRLPKEFEAYIRKTIGQRLSEPQIEKFVTITFPKAKSMTICEIVIPSSNVPIFVKSRNKDEEFYIMQAGKPTRLGPKQQIKYIKENFEELV